MNQIVQIVSEVETQLFIHSDGSRYFSEHSIVKKKKRHIKDIFLEEKERR